MDWMSDFGFPWIKTDNAFITSCSMLMKPQTSISHKQAHKQTNKQTRMSQKHTIFNAR